MGLPPVDPALEVPVSATEVGWKPTETRARPVGFQPTSVREHGTSSAVAGCRPPLSALEPNLSGRAFASPGAASSPFPPAFGGKGAGGLGGRSLDAHGIHECLARQ